LEVKVSHIDSQLRRGHPLRDSTVALAFIFPSLLGFLLFYALPLARGIYLSLTNWDLFNPPKFIGFKNYISLFHDGEFWNSLWVTVQYVLWNIPLQTVLALLIAFLMSRLRSSNLFRGVILLPWLLPNVVVALLWLVILDPAIGIVNEGIKALGGAPLGFLNTTELALPVIAGINTWKFTGYTALVIFAGLQNIPKEIDEAALIDGASDWRLFRKITLPLLRPVMTFVIITSVIGSFQIYDTVAVATRGGPIESTWVINFFIYKNGFEYYKMGYASAAAMILFLLLLGVSFVQLKMMRINDVD
jgi:multiple sugar transport system permease protein